MIRPPVPQTQRDKNMMNNVEGLQSVLQEYLDDWNSKQPVISFSELSSNVADWRNALLDSARACSVSELALASKLLRAPAERFPGAARHQRVLEDRMKCLEEYEARVVSDRGRFVANVAVAQAVERFLRSTRKLESEILVPWLNEVRAEPLGEDDCGPVAAEITSCIAHLQLEQQRLREESRLVHFLCRLQQTQTNAARQVLAEFDGEVSAELTHICTRLCGLIDQLQKHFGKIELPVGSDVKKWSTSGLASVLDFDTSTIEQIESLTRECKACVEMICIANRPCATDCVPILQRVETLLQFRDAAAKLREYVMQGDFDDACAQALRVDAIVPAANALSEAFAPLGETYRQQSWREARDQEQWKTAIERIEALNAAIQGALPRIVNAGGQFLREAFSRRQASLNEEVQTCRDAQNDEHYLSQALGHLDRGEQKDANQLLNKLKSQAPSITLWRRAATLMIELYELAGDNGESLAVPQINADTGMPPDGDSLHAARLRIKDVHSLAKDTRKALQKAMQNPKFQCNCRYADDVCDQADSALVETKTMERYAEIVRRIRNMISEQTGQEGGWEQAIRDLDEFCGETANHPALRLVGALQHLQTVERVRQSQRRPRAKLQEIRHLDLKHPLLRDQLEYRQQLEYEVFGHDRARFERILDAASSIGDTDTSDSLLTAPVLSQPDQLEEFRRHLDELKATIDVQPQPLSVAAMNRFARDVLQAAGENRIALQARLGDVNTVAQAVKEGRGEVLPHHLAVAALSPFRDQEYVFSEELLGAVIGACAVTAASPRYRQHLIDHTTCTDAAATDSSDYQMQEWIASELQEQLGIDWGSSDDTESWAFRWAVECEAVHECERADGTGQLPWPMGPLLISYFGLEAELNAAIDGRYELRRWYGPCAIGEVLIRQGLAERALEALPQPDDVDAPLASNACGYAAAVDAIAFVKGDLVRCRIGILLNLLVRHELKLRKLQPKDPEWRKVPHAAADLCAQLLSLLERPETEPEFAHQLSETLTRVCRRLEEHLEDPVVNLGRAATLQDGEIRKKCMDGMIDAVCAARDRWSAAPRNKRIVSAHVDQKLEASLNYMKARRAGLFVDYAQLKLLRLMGLDDEEERIRIADDMLAMSEQCVRDAPGVDSYLLHAQCLILRSVEGTGGGVESDVLEKLTEIKLFATNRWGARDVKHLTELIDSASAIGHTENWLRDLWSDDMRRREDPRE